MKVTREQCEENRQRILDVAGRLFREKGFDGIGVADVMKAAGLTHGGFYGHFKSRDDLVAQSCTKVLSGTANIWRKTARRRSEEGARAIVDAYLSPKHRDHPGTGCPFAALGGEVARQGKQVRRAFTEGVRAVLEELAGVTTGRSKAARRQKALATMSGLVGAIVLARVVDDRTLSDEILAAAAAAFGGRQGSGNEALERSPRGAVR
jgi:TetR/AcrR family transcriptional regulator, transcriptional repressor for nem operon